ncbi:hypothetical protein ACFQY3_14770 [Paenibacillus farraposensis]|uniref:hypothetical protein n=1 Tax=Paenibacillus farraposensis TaxID=2807095 RepID=UPI00361694BD
MNGMPYKPNQIYDFDHDFWDEPSEFEQQVDEWKEALMNSMKEGHKQEIARLQKENGELRLVKSQLENMKLEHRQKLHELDLQKQDLERKVRRERLDTLMEDFILELWVPESDYKLGEKCDKCDDNRRFHYKTPMGRDDSETCGCAVKIPYYKPELYTVYSFGMKDDGKNSDHGTEKNTVIKIITNPTVHTLPKPSMKVKHSKNSGRKQRMNIVRFLRTKAIVRRIVNGWQKEGRKR